IANGAIPDHRSFSVALTSFEVLTKDAMEAGVIDGSFVYGSVALGVVNRRSDFDSFIALSYGSQASYILVKDIYAAINSRAPTVPLSPMVYSKQALSGAHHDIDRFFGQHLNGNFRIVFGKDPASYMRYGQQPAGDILANYLAHKKRSLINAYISPEPMDYHDGCGLQRMLELPAAVGRKAVQALIEVGEFNGTLDNSADRYAVIHAARKIMAEELIESRFDELVRCNTDYDDILEATLNDELSKSQYESEIVGLMDKLPMAVKWLSSVEQSFLPRLPRSSSQ
ncbi:MAG: hypothetical protein ABSB12_01815, partial [Candidatus Saccharimonadales bacterium]